MGEPKPSLLQRGDTRGQVLRRLAGGDRTGRGGAGHPALMADPVDRRVRALRNGFLGTRKHRRLTGEAEFEEIDPVPQADQALAQRERGELARRRGNERLDLLAGTDRAPPACPRHYTSQ